MNFLAHAVLSFDQPEILAGNMISDFVKGKKKYDYAEGVLNGILLHRSIDEFTDQHPCTQMVKSFFKDDYRLYASPIADIVYDYFVANDPGNFTSSQHLQDFAQHTYQQLDQLSEIFPEPFNRMFPYMKQQNWLYHYREDDGIRKGLAGLERRAKYMTSSHKAFELFLLHKKEIGEIYQEFFGLLKLHAVQQLALLIHR